MDAREFVKFIRTNPDEELSIRLLNKSFQNYWLRGHDPRNWFERRLKFVRARMIKRFQEEFAPIMEQVAREGYSGEHLERRAMQIYLRDDKPITEEDVKPKSK
jgi:hypothetical protein